ncbi:MAG TPA: hypothetical protein PLO89_02100 [Spirochaetota bacterium]|nr:hypothetical protein [Spirochaetota bacterium]
MDFSNFQKALFKLIKDANEINYHILTKKITSVIDVKKSFLKLKKEIESGVSPNLKIMHEGKEVNCLKEISEEIEKLYAVSLKVFRTLAWGDFAKLNNSKFPELYKMLVDKDGELLRTFDDFKGTVAMMDFHGYTQFSNDVKYNKTPLQEFGDILPQKIERVCALCKSIVYEIEGDALIIMGPENPVYILNAVLSIIELARQKSFNPDSNPKNFHDIEIKNTMIRPFEMNAAITTGGETFINKKGNIIGTIISEASRMLKVIGLKKNNRSGVVINEKIYRKLEKFKDTKTCCHLSPFDFKISESTLIDVKGMRLNLREIFIDKKEGLKPCDDNILNLTEEIKKRSSSKWFNIFIYYIKIIISTLSYVKCSIKMGSDEMNQDKIRSLMEMKLNEWIRETSPDAIRYVLKISSILFNEVDEVRDSLAIFFEFVQENYRLIAEKLDTYYSENLRQEEIKNPSLKRLVDNYNSEIKKVKNRVLPKRILETILSDSRFSSGLLDTPYVGKK